MKDRRSPLSIVLLALALMLAVFVIIVVLSAPAFGRESDPYKATAAAAPSLIEVTRLRPV